MLGCGASAWKDGPRVASTAVGQGKTSQWKLAALDHSTSACVCFEITADGSSEKGAKASPNEVRNCAVETVHVFSEGCKQYDTDHTTCAPRLPLDMTQIPLFQPFCALLLLIVVFGCELRSSFEVCFGSGSRQHVPSLLQEHCEECWE